MIIDLVILGIVLISAVVAFFRGFIKEVLTIVGLGGAAVGAFGRARRGDRDECDHAGQRDRMQPDRARQTGLHAAGSSLRNVAAPPNGVTAMSQWFDLAAKCQTCFYKFVGCNKQKTQC